MNYTPNWNRQSTSSGYSVTHCPDHPRAWSTGYVYTHRLVMERALGRLLEDHEIVHHVDGNKRNNVISNLEVLTPQEHQKVHHGPVFVTLVCAYCEKVFERRRNQRPKAKGYVNAFCCRSCNGKFNSTKTV